MLSTVVLLLRGQVNKWSKFFSFIRVTNFKKVTLGVFMFRCLFVVVLFLCFNMSVLAQTTGRILGTVSHAETQQGLSDVNLVLKNTVLGTVSDASGRFVLPMVPAGNYTLLVSRLGYATLEQHVSVDASKDVPLTLQLNPQLLRLDAVHVEAERAYSAASSKTIRAFDLQIRPNNTAHDMLQQVPGLFIAQHAGGGKAEQIFLRGFDADHGTDVAISVDGVPVNMVSHGHGQGYADLHFQIPELIETVDVHKGPYFANYGNFATAGAVTFHTRDHLEHNSVRVEAGEFGTSRVTTLMQLPTQGPHQGAYFAGQFYATDGPFRSPQDFQRFNLFGKFHTHVSEMGKLAFSVSAFGSAWDASGQIPMRSVANGSLGRFEALDDLEGGTTSRQDLSLIYTLGESDQYLKLQAYTSRYTFKLFSNFTFYLDDPIQGDMIEQIDNRHIVGLNAEYRFLNAFGDRLAITTFGGGFRSDGVRVALWHSPDRVRQTQRVNSDIVENNLFLWAREELLLSPKLRMQLGLRADYFTFDVEDHLENVATNTGLPHASGYAQKRIVNPKGSVVFSPVETLDLFVNAGSSFHSNDARDVVIAKRIKELDQSLGRQGLNSAQIDAELRARNFDPDQRNIETLPRAIGAELGIRTQVTSRLHLGVAGWWLRSDQELVYVGDAGTTEISDQTRRMGLDFEGRMQLASWMWADADLNISRGKVKDAPSGADVVPLAPRLTSTGGLTMRHPKGLEGSLRYRLLDDRPANEDNSVVAEGYSVVDLSVAYQIGAVKLLLQVDNVLNTEWNEAQFDTESLLRGETEPVSEIHFTPGNPRNVQAGVSYQF